MLTPRSARRIGAALLLTMAATASPGEAFPLLGPPPVFRAVPVHSDPAESSASPVDITSAFFGQQGLELVLGLRTARGWRPAELRGGRSLCLELSPAARSAVAGRLCVASHAGRPVLRWTAAGGAKVRAVSATVRRPDARTLLARLPRTALPVPNGPTAWRATSAWSASAQCSAGCADTVPDAGALRLRLTDLAEPACFGAAARDPQTRCVNPALARTVYPRPDAAYRWPNSPCRPYREPRRTAIFDPCEFGVGRSRAVGTIALIGDSHSTHWRAALEVVARAERWRGVSINRPGCPFSTQIPRSPALGPAACRQLHADTIAWLDAHPEVTTVFVSDWAEPPSGPQGGIGGYGGGPAQFGAMLDQLPSSVQHILVLRDDPATTLAAMDCVDRHRHHHQVLRGACGAPRSAVLTPDPGAEAAAQRRPRARVIDLTRYFCNASSCFPVIGGVYVYKDDTHINAVFSQTLGPFLLRRLAAFDLGASAP